MLEHCESVLGFEIEVMDYQVREPFSNVYNVRTSTTRIILRKIISCVQFENH